MSVVMNCQCSASFELRDEFAGRMVKCPQCGTESRAPGDKLTPHSQADPVFDRDVFLLRQKAFAISAKYAVSDEGGTQILHIERPAHFFRNLLATLAGITTFFLVFAAAGALSGSLQRAGSVGASGVVVLLGFVAAFVGLIVVGVGLSRKRHVTFYRGASKGEKLLEILQLKKVELFTTTFSIRDAKSQTIATLRKNNFSNILRRRWRLYTPSGRLILMAQEDSMILSLLRRVLGPFFGLLRTNYVLVNEAGKPLGEFQRKLTILDRYALDMRADPHRNVDRRLALAVGVVLDTGERR